jgi:TRAP-type C4-dicarboxylate transport system permease small subunit
LNKKKESALRVLEPLAKLCAILAGVLLTGITLMTCGSLIGRNTTGDSIVGAFELTGVAAGAAIALFMPLCQVRRGNIIVDFFTAGLPDRVNDKFDRLGAFLLALVFALLAWRSTLGGINVWESNSETQIMGFPEWVVYAFMVPGFALTALIALWQAVLGFGETKPEDPVAAAEEAVQ